MSDVRDVEPVVMRRRAALAVLVGTAAAVLAALYLWRAADQGGLASWLIGAVLAVLAVAHLAQWADSRTPLLVADETGVRLRVGDEWHGLPWSDVTEVEVTPRQGWRDGHLVVRSGEDVDGTTEGLGPRSRRVLAANRERYGGAFAVPLGLATAVSTDDVAGALRGLREHGGGDPAVAVAAGTGPEPGPDDDGRPEPEAEPRRRVASLREVRRALRADVTRRGSAVEQPQQPAPVLGMLALAEDDQPPRPRGNISLVLEPAATPLEPEPEPAETRPADEADTGQAVIGPRLTEARQRLGISVDELAARTRIRPHVIEGIEADDFGPCAGDFYARGHLRTLSRVLGVEPEPLLEEFDRRYATAPVDARRVFEAELAGATGGIRGVGSGGPRWGALVATVLVLVLVWALASWVTDSAQPARSGAPSLEHGSGGLATPVLAGRDPARLADEFRTGPVATARLRAVGADSQVVARTGSGRKIFDAVLRDGQTRRVRSTEPFTLRIADAGAVDVLAEGTAYGRLGPAGEPAWLPVVPRRTTG